ncbi:AAA family ATPase [Raineya orbicola]|jgi:hypothetical protein|uniref:Putative AAA-ATPase n=1 Tax=Raineya orbicola TaxID=2016530 RepID=A0A2N3IHA2_9BACT|nr:AAA family ATPase [Raineya orbicola]PKQ69712.1 putative AAA-ATPase [Raineya orbicola]
MNSQVFFPYGISNFEKIVRENLVFVDKTNYLPLLENYSNIAFLRPRRFGKSLFVSLLEHYYDINRKEKFQELFGKYYIGKNPTSLANSYRILFFNFSAIDTRTSESSYRDFLNSIKISVRDFLIGYGLLSLREAREILDEPTPEIILRSFFGFYEKNHFNHKIYLLIDEYDHFTNEILIRDLQEFKETVSLNGYVRKFYEAIKNATQQGVVDRFFITGVSPITLDSLTSGFNIVRHLTHEKDFEAMMGFTESEVRNLLGLVLQDKRQEEAVLNDMRRYYNGYRFYPSSQENIYNSDMVLYFLDHFKQQQQYPRQMLDPNIAPDYGKLKAMFEVANWQENVKVLNDVLEKGYVDTQMILQFSFEKHFGRKEFINFLFYLGNLTIQETDITGTILFKIPNQVIAELYWQYYAEILQEQANLPAEADLVLSAVREMAISGKTESFFTLVQKLLQHLSNRDFIRFDEKHIKMVLMAYFIQSNIFWVQSEREISGGGYVDLELFIRPNNPFKHHQFAIELKYLKKEETHLLQSTMQEAKEQILHYYQQDTLLKSKEQLHLLAVVVVKDEIFVEEVKM